MMSNLQSPLIEPVPVLAPTLPDFIVKPYVLTPRQCEQLVDTTISRSRFYRNNSKGRARRVDIAYVYPDHARWLFAKIGTLAARRNVWGLALSAITEPIRIQRYRRGDYSDVHSDYDYTSSDRSKLSIVIPLVDPHEWKGGALEIGNNLAAPHLERGDAVLFPSFIPHRVTRIIRGSRVILSAWVSGPSLR
jgi:PKHD-type hydroxylase